MHGLSGHGARWRRFAEQQLAGFRVIAPDLRGHGRSPMLPPWNLAQHTADVIALLDSLGLDGVPLMGHSYGGSIAIDVANLVPSRISHLVLVDPSQGLPPEEALEIAEETLQAAVFDTREQARADQQNRWETISAEVVDEEIAENVVRGEDGRWRYRYSQAMAVTAWGEMAREAVLPPKNLPTLLVPAKQADYVSPEFVAACRSQLGDDVTVHEVDCGHVIYLERPEELGALVTSFV